MTDETRRNFLLRYAALALAAAAPLPASADNSQNPPVDGLPSEPVTPPPERPPFKALYGPPPNQPIPVEKLPPRPTPVYGPPPGQPPRLTPPAPEKNQ